MSTYLAISAVSAVLKSILENGFKEDFVDTNLKLEVTLKAPHAIPTEPDIAGLNIFLYLVSLNSGYASYDLPRRDLRGRLISKPLVGLDLYYILTPFSGKNDPGKNDEILIQQILGSTIRIMHENPILTEKSINDAFKSIKFLDPTNKILNSHIARQVEKIRIIYKPLSLEEITKIWSSHLQTNYRLSVTYLASVVLIEGKEEAVSPLPVKERKIFVKQLRYLFIERIEPYILQWDENPANMKIDIIGKNLSSDKLKVIIEESEIASDLVSVISNERITVILPSDLLHAGIKTLKILHGISTENDNASPSSGSQHLAFESNNSYFVLAPRIETQFPVRIQQGKEDLNLDFKPALEENQKLEIMIGEKIFSQHFEDSQIFPTESVKIKTDNFPEGKSLFRMRIDGAESFLVTGQDPENPEYKKYIGPIIDVFTEPDD